MMLSLSDGCLRLMSRAPEVSESLGRKPRHSRLRYSTVLRADLVEEFRTFLADCMKEKPEFRCVQSLA